MTDTEPPKPAYPVPTREDYFDFLVRCFFGNKSDPLMLCVGRAYLDMNRTMHGVSRLENSDALRTSAYQMVAEMLRELPDTAIASASAYDTWHEAACTRLIGLYRDAGFGFTVGQAQKWLNMALKYIYTLGEQRLPGYERLYPFAHIPIDSLVLKDVAQRGGPVLTVPWSRLDDYAAYLAYQHKCRTLFAGSCPLAAEFRLWQDAGT